MEHSLGQFTEIANRVWTAVAQPCAVNIGVVAGEHGALVVDTGSCPEQGRAIRDAAQRIAGVPVVGVVVTHAHHDHAYGLAGFDGVASYAHATAAAALASLDAASTAELAGRGLAASDLAVPTDTFNLAKAVDLGGRVVELVHYGPGHTAGDVVALVPDARTLFAGDLVENPTPYAGAESDLQGWPKALDGLLGLFRDAWTVVPGHGDVTDREFVMMQRGTLAGLYLQLEWQFMTGARPADVVQRLESDYPIESFRDAIAPLYDRLKATGKIGRPQLPVIS